MASNLNEMLASAKEFVLSLRTPREENFEIKQAQDRSKYIEIAELTYESYHGDPPSIWYKLYTALFFTFWFALSSVFVVVGIGLIFWYIGGKILYESLKEMNQVETYYLDETSNQLIKETIAFGRTEIKSWDRKVIRKFLVGLDVDITRHTDSNTGMSHTHRSDHYTLTMILNEPPSDRQGDLGQFDTVDILKTDIEPRLLELCLEVAQRFENTGFVVERMVRTVKLEQGDMVCKVCETINPGDSSYCSHCGTYLDEDH